MNVLFLSLSPENERTCRPVSVSLLSSSWLVDSFKKNRFQKFHPASIVFRLIKDTQFVRDILTMANQSCGVCLLGQMSLDLAAHHAICQCLHSWWVRTQSFQMISNPSQSQQVTLSVIFHCQRYLTIFPRTTIDICALMASGSAVSSTSWVDSCQGHAWRLSTSTKGKTTLNPAWFLQINKAAANVVNCWKTKQIPCWSAPMSNGLVYNK